MIKIALTLLSLTTPVQYGGPPMWDRDYGNPEYRRERPMPPPRPYGPQMGPCIYHGDCRGPRDRDFRDQRPYGMPPYPPGRRYDDEY